MTISARRPALPWLVPSVAVVALCAAVGGAMAVRAQWAPLVVVVAVAAIAASRWRMGVVALLLALPFAGVPVLLAGDAGQVALDALIVLPLYAAFALHTSSERSDVVPERLGVALPAIGAFALLVLAYTIISPTMLTAAIGVKVWLAYMPMLAIGYAFVQNATDFDDAMRLPALAGLVPATIALLEWAYVWHGGNFGPFERLYGVAGIDDRARFVVFTTPAGNIDIPRVFSLFASVSQYAGLALVAYAAALSRLFVRRDLPTIAIAAVLGLAAMASGARAVYLLLPAITFLAVVINGTSLRRGRMLAGALLVAIAGAAALAGSPLAIVEELPLHVGVTLSTAWRELASSLAIVGHGTGWDTNAALRYANISDRRYVENWYAKSALELGVFGLAAIVFAFGAMLVGLINGVRALDARARAAAAPIVALMLVVMIALFKGPYIDLQPLSVYFWLFIGLVAGLIRCSRRETVAAQLEVVR